MTNTGKGPKTGKDVTAHALYDGLQEAMGYRFNDIALLQTALTHKSAQQAPTQDYERLEFLGDRVLGLAVSHALYTHFADEDQGALTKRFHALVQQNALATIADKLDLSAYIITDATKQAAKQPSVMSDVVEAIIAAIFLDDADNSAEDAARDFILSFLDITNTTTDDALANPKSALQEWAMARKLALPHYELLGVSGPDHAPRFTIEARLDEHITRQATGASKKEAEQQAAKELLRMVKQKESS